MEQRDRRRGVVEGGQSADDPGEREREAVVGTSRPKSRTPLSVRIVANTNFPALAPVFDADLRRDLSKFRKTPVHHLFLTLNPKLLSSLLLSQFSGTTSAQAQVLK